MSTDHNHVPIQYAACRSFLHAWEFTTVDRSGGEYLQGMRCMRCSTEKTVRISARTGLRQGGNKYKYPEDLNPEVAAYKMPKGTGGLTAEERGQIVLGFVKVHHDEVAARRTKRKKA